MRIENGTLLQAYIISGPQGSGKHKLALRMASSMVCSGSGKKPCMKCPDCRKAQEGIHPDIITVTCAADKKEILVDQIREIVSSAAVMPNDAAKKVYIIDGADKMNIRAQNALLKILEEPPTFVSFILIAENSGGIIETIHSRCIEIKLSSPENNGPADLDTTSEYAKEVMDVVRNGTPLGICELILKAEKLDKNIFSEFIERGRAEAIKRMKDALSAEREMSMYADIARVFEKCREYVDFNVSNGHICGLLMASLIGLQNKK